ncbi:hypothetical protein [Thaumasiovibrio sp. DFM-14]|uniref:hypothetical protein n=1 Tax=Thaumasiovibrio sp. DFM-14 TaxID=3384792 RepID=UPI00399F50F1
MQYVRFSLTVLCLFVIGFYVPPYIKQQLQPAPPSQFDCYLDELECKTAQMHITLAHQSSAQNNVITVHTTQNIDAEQLEIKLTGLNMDMGQFNVSIPKLSGNTFQTSLWFPACTHDEMIWAGQLVSPNGNLEQQIAIKVARQ